MRKYFEPEFKKIRRRLFVFILRMGEPSIVLQRNIVYPKQVFLTGYPSFAKNAKIMKKPKPITII